MSSIHGLSINHPRVTRIHSRRGKQSNQRNKQQKLSKVKNTFNSDVQEKYHSSVENHRTSQNESIQDISLHNRHSEELSSFPIGQQNTVNVPRSSFKTLSDNSELQLTAYNSHRNSSKVNDFNLKYSLASDNIKLSVEKTLQKKKEAKRETRKVFRGFCRICSPCCCFLSTLGILLVGVAIAVTVMLLLTKNESTTTTVSSTSIIIVTVTTDTTTTETTSTTSTTSITTLTTSTTTETTSTTTTTTSSTSTSTDTTSITTETTSTTSTSTETTLTASSTTKTTSTTSTSTDTTTITTETTLSTSTSTETTSTTPRASVFNVNMVVNGDAETGPCATDDNVTSPTGWNTNGDITQLAYNNTSIYNRVKTIPSSANPRNCLFYGNSEANTSMWQRINLTDYTDSSLIDNQTVRFNLSAWLGGFSTHNDTATVSLSFINQSNQIIGNMISIGPVTNTDRKNVTSFLFRQTTGMVPIGTRSVTVFLVIDRSIGPINDGYADNIGVFLYI